ncbi:MAG: hypothetical protein H0X13_16340 [Ramlibacter sp.]|nr:hypothetical protein [Ramlibacter sp.]
MPALKIPRKYWTLAELRGKWKLPPESPDLQRLVMDGILKPCLMLATDLHPVVVQDGQAVVLRDQLQAVSGRWLYPVYPKQVEPFNCVYECLSDMALPVEGSTLWGVPVPLTLDDVMRSAVVMADDVQAAEAELRKEGARRNIEDDELSVKQERTRDKMLVSLAVETLGWEPASDRSNGATRLAEIAEGLGLKVSVNAVKEHLRLAWERCTPSV